MKKYDELRKIIARHGPMLIAYSGGVDSTLLAVIAKEVLKDRTRCVLLVSPVVPKSEVAGAQARAQEAGLVLDILPVPLLEDREFLENPPDRCAVCKKLLAARLKQHARDHGLACVADGANVSDTGEYRPGLRASTEAGIVHPFIEAGITKQDIREIAQDLGLPLWQKPSAACLASRIPYGDPITAGNLQMIEEAEDYLATLGLGQLRVRLHGTIARIEVHKDDWGKILDQHQAITARFRSLGFAYVTLDLGGYRSGSMDEVLQHP